MGVSVHEAADEFYFAKSTEGLSPRTMANYRSSVKRFLDWADGPYPGLRVEGLSAEVFRGYITHLQALPTINDVTVTKLVRDVKVFSRWLEAEGHVDSSPFKPGGRQRVKVPKFSQKFPEAITPENFEKLLAACDLRHPVGRRDHALIRFLYDTGVRVGEACNLQVEDIDIAAGKARVHGKGRRERVVFFGPETQRSLQRYRARLNSKMLAPQRPTSTGGIMLPNAGGRPTDHPSFFLSRTFGPVRPTAVHQMLSRLAKRARVPGPVNPHAFRHGFGVGFLLKGGDIRSLQQLMGHAMVTTTETYTHMTEEQLGSMHSQFSPAGHRGS